MAIVRPADLKYYTKVRDYTDVHVTGGRAYYQAAVRPTHQEYDVCLIAFMTCQKACEHAGIHLGACAQTFFL